MLCIPTAEDINDLADGGHRNTDARWRDVARGGTNRPDVIMEVEDVEFVVDGESGGEFSTKGVGLLVYDCDSVRASCTWACGFLIDLQRIV